MAIYCNNLKGNKKKQKIIVISTTSNVKLSKNVIKQKQRIMPLRKEILSYYFLINRIALLIQRMILAP